MDVADFETPPPPLMPPLTTWNDLSWRHLANTEEALQALSHASINTVLPEIEPRQSGVGTPRIRRTSRCNARCASPFTQAKCFTQGPR